MFRVDQNSVSEDNQADQVLVDDQVNQDSVSEDDQVVDQVPVDDQVDQILVDDHIPSVEENKKHVGENGDIEPVDGILNDEGLSKFEVNPLISVDVTNKMFDPASLIGVDLTREEKEYLLKLEPCQRPESVLSQPERCRMQGDRN